MILRSPAPELAPLPSLDDAFPFARQLRAALERAERRARPRTRRARGTRRAIRALWISDVHLGTRGAKARELVELLDAHEPEQLYLVGDFLDGWRAPGRIHWDAHQDAVLDRVLDQVARGARVAYLTGNHDEFLDGWIGRELGGIRVLEDAVHQTADGRRLLVLHGDQLDACEQRARWISTLGDRAYGAAQWADRGINRVRTRFGAKRWPISKWLKERVKGAVGFANGFESALLAAAAERGLDGVVCGHVHKPRLLERDGLVYANDGDWVENCTALVERLDGSLELVGAPARALAEATA